MPSSITLFGTSAKFIDAVRKAGLEPSDTHDLSSAAHHALDRLAAVAGQLRASSMTASSRTCISPRSRAAPTSSPASCSACRRSRSGPARSRRPASAWPSMSGDDDGQPLAGRQGRAGLHQGRSRRCRSASGTIPTARSTTPPISSASPTSGAMATSPNGPTHGGMIIHGRSDATLNPGGVRIGTAEIYDQVEQIAGDRRGAVHRPGLGQRRARRAVRPAVPRASHSTRLCKPASSPQIRRGASPRHVPAKIVAVADIPRTKSGKITRARRARRRAWPRPSRTTKRSPIRMRSKRSSTSRSFHS